jgi:hypothetical protein
VRQGRTAHDIQSRMGVEDPLHALAVQLRTSDDNHADDD